VTEQALLGIAGLPFIVVGNVKQCARIEIAFLYAFSAKTTLNIHRSNCTRLPKQQMPPVETTIQ
jgi:hypothetical protein